MENQSTKVPGWFWVVAIIALIWNIMGVMAYLGQAFMTDEAMQMMTQAEQDLYNSTPSWATAAFAFAVWAGLLGCILLLLRKKLAYSMFIISIMGVLIQSINSFFLSNAVEVYGTQGMVMSTLIIGFAVFLLWFSKRSISRGWLN